MRSRCEAPCSTPDLPLDTILRAQRIFTTHALGTLRPTCADPKQVRAAWRANKVAAHYYAPLDEETP